ncbi:MAG: endolytic transglycosylase MltG [Candidatus Doudnabacteria bacterium]|nr:endolytic transglycosylase MltG [Candidatus Doudnabacteria bacterium]
MFNSEYTVQDPKRGKRNILILIFVLFGIVILIAAVYFFTKVNLPGSSSDVPVEFTVEQGDSTREVAQQLDQQGIINSPWVFVVNAIVNSAGGRIQAGEYILNTNMSIAQILDVLTAGKVVRDELTVRAVEGWTNKQVGEYLEENEIFSQSEFNQALLSSDLEFKFSEGKKFDYQGFLFPDTYQISRKAPAQDLVAKMLNNFEAKVSDDLLAGLSNSGRSLADAVILASIIEKEVGRNKDKITEQDQKDMEQERKLVASVFYNRLSIGMPLESDATVNYITGKSDRQVSLADTKLDSPYNTYRVRGLPPAPIGNPGLDSIIAAIKPADSDYFFFINKTDGEAVFAKTLAEHNENRAKYLD